MSKHLLPVLILGISSCSSTKYYLQKAYVYHLPPCTTPRVVMAYRPNQLTIYLSGTFIDSRTLSFNNGEHSKVDSNGNYSYISYDGFSGSGNRVFPANKFVFKGNNVTWDMTGFKGNLALTKDFTRFFSVISDIQIGGNRNHFGFDFSGGASFRYRASSAGVRAECLLGLKSYHYNAEVLSYAISSSYPYSNADQINLATPKGNVSFPYIQLSILANGDLGLPVGLFVRGSLRLSPDIYKEKNEATGVLISKSGAHINTSTIVPGAGLYAHMRDISAYLVTDFIFPLYAKKGASIYPILSYGISRDFKFR